MIFNIKNTVYYPQNAITYRVFFFLLERQAPAQRSPSVASYTACRGDLTADNWSWTNDRNKTR